MEEREEREQHRYNLYITSHPSADCPQSTRLGTKRELIGGGGGGCHCFLATVGRDLDSKLCQWLCLRNGNRD